ncbi:hypothetical protein [Algoriphagus sp.]|uniref:hypothetical protein n=1 Tax=Algoriphagus sp. TaxID=1872435 RepID=UPI0027174F31|nr:hypothetical protein [Algoriphagus sp.]MDO8967522.1 hypothetical protein [Algoriphagus sp.]MDP3201832.1 hypothetical protein [Algoriphagus sp.]
METFIKRFVFLLFFFSASTAGKSQDCDPTQLATIPGTFKAGIAGSVQNVSKTDLVKEKETLSKINQKISSDFSPVGMEITYSNAFGYNEFYGKNWVADPYIYSLYFLRYVCGTSAKNNRNYQPEISSNTQVYFQINKLSGQGGGIELFAAEIPDDREEKYFKIKDWPERIESGVYQWIITEPQGKETRRVFNLIITKNDKLPFRALTKKEFILFHLPGMNRFLKELEQLRVPIDPKADEESAVQNQIQTQRINEQKKIIEDFEALLTDLSPEELEEPAIVEKGQSWYEFLGFKNVGDTNILHLVVPDMGYFDTSLPKWRPQFFCINFLYETKIQVYLTNINSLIDDLDIKFFQSLLEKP